MQEGPQISKDQQEALKKKLNEQKFDWKTLATFLCQFHKVSDIPEIQVYGAGAVDAHALCSAHTIGVEHVIEGAFNAEKPLEEQVVSSKIFSANNRRLFKSTQPRERFQHPVTKEPMECDLSSVSFYQVTCRAYSSTFGLPIAVRMDWEHSAQCKLENSKVTENMFAAAGAVKGGFAVLDPTVDMDESEQALQSFPLPELNHGFQNSRYAKTFMYVNEKNLWNGIVEIPAEVCIQSGLPVWQGAPQAPEDLVVKQLQSLKIQDPNSPQGQAAQKEIHEQYAEQFSEQFNQENSKPITHYYFLPADHVLAWGYVSDEYRMEHGHCVYRFSYRIDANSDAVLLYFIVPNPLMDHLVQEASEVWLQKVVDKRPLDSVGMEFIPTTTPAYSNPTQQSISKNGTLKLRTYYSYVCGPKIQQATMDALAPRLPEYFFSCKGWNKEEVARKAAFEEWERQNK